jgi:gentisate 1,2-dioxygenase
MNPAQTARQALYQAMSPHHLTPLWEVLHSLVPTSPNTPCVPMHWPYATVRPYLMQAGELITAEEAVRRVLILENPALRGQSAVTQSLYAGLQLIRPGEIAPSHRHTQSALRFIVEGSGAYTAVDGERTMMHPGDFIITPNWTFHDHGNEASEPVIWLDGLDIPMLRFFDAGFAENGDAASQAVTKPAGNTWAAYGQNMQPVRMTGGFQHTSPIFNYPYDRSREALAKLAKDAPIDPHLGVALRYVNPVTGRSAMPTLGTVMQLLPKGFAGRASRRTDGTVYSVVEGSCTVDIEFKNKVTTYQVGPRDHFVVPSWHSVRFSASEDCVLFNYSDYPVQQALGIWREENL